MATAVGLSGGSTLHGVTDDQKRWVVFGIALSKILVPQIRPFVEQEVQNQYVSLSASHNIHTQSTSGRLKNWPTFLKYENINGNDALPKKGGKYDYSKFDCRVTSHIDFAKLYVENHMAKFNAFDEHCDASAVLGLLSKVPFFSLAVHSAAGDVRQARNAWAHCVFSDWDPVNYQQSFDEMTNLAKALGLPPAVERNLLGELKDWETKGTILCMNATVDPDLLKLVQQHVNTLRTDVEQLTFEVQEDREQVSGALNDISTSLEELEARISENMASMLCEQEARMASLSNKVDTLQTDVETLKQHHNIVSVEIGNFEADIAFFAKRHDSDTRQWLFDDFDAWFHDPGDSRAYVLLGDPGVGKSVLAAVLAKRTKGAGHLGAAYFCRHNDSTRNDPRYLLGTIASQLCKCNSQYNEKLGGDDGVRKLLSNSNLGVQELFTKLLQEPLGKCNPCQQRKLVVIDALDETEYESREDFLDLIMHRFPLLPHWLVFFITSRPEDTVKFRLKKYNPCVRICAGNIEHHGNFYQHHDQDIKLFLRNKVDFSHLPFSVDDIAKKCKGSFLYAFYIAKDLKVTMQSGKPFQLVDVFPGDFDSYLLKNFKRVFDKVGSALFKKLFGCAIASPTPLPVSFISYVLQREKSSLEKQHVVDSLSLFMVLTETLTFLHNLIPAWLTNEDKARELFIDRSIAANYLKDIIVEILSASVIHEQSQEVAPSLLDYVLRVGIRFLCGFARKDSLKIIFSCLTSFQFIQKRIQSKRMEIYSLIEDFKLASECYDVHVDGKKEILQEICSALERNIYVLRECPHLLHSCLRNASKTVERNVVILDGVSATWMEWNWLPYPKTEIPHDMSCFALSPDKKLLAGGKGRHISLFDACSLEKVLGPIEMTETGEDIKHLEFSPDGKFVFFGRLDKWFSVEQKCVRELPQFTTNYRCYEWGSFISGGRYIVVKATEDHPFRTRVVTPFTTRKHRLACIVSIFFMWATQELHQMQSIESFSCNFPMLVHMLTYENLQSGTREELKAFAELLSLWKSKVQPEACEGWRSFEEDRLSNCLEFMRDCGDGGGGGNCRECSEFERNNRQITLTIVRQRVIDLYPEIFEYQLWDVQSGRPVLEEAFSSGVELSPFSYLCHLTTALTNHGTLFRDVDKAVSLCNVALINALYYITCRYYTLPRRVTQGESFWLSSFFVTNAPTEFQNRPAMKESRMSLDRKWIAVIMHVRETNDRNDCFSFLSGKINIKKPDCVSLYVYEKRNQFDRVDDGNPVHVIDVQVKLFAFTDDSMFLVYSTADKSLHALHLQNGTILSSASGFSPLLFAPKKQLGYFFHVHDEERIRFAKDLPSSLLRLISFQSGKALEAAFISAGTIFSSFSPDAVDTCTSWNETAADVKSCVFSQNGNLVAIHLGTKILLFDCCKLLCSFSEDRHECDVSYLAFSPDSTLLLYCIQNSTDCPHFKVWDVQNRDFLTTFDSPSRLLPIDCCCFSSDNTKLVICGEFSIEIWEYAACPCRLMATVETVVIYTEGDTFTHCTVAPENDLLACCIADRILLYPLNTSIDQSILELPRGHLGKVEFCQFLKGNRYLISYGVDGTVFLWDLGEWKAIAYAKIAQGRERIITMAVTPEIDTAVCLTSFGRLSLIKLCGLVNEMPIKFPTLLKTTERGKKVMGSANRGQPEEQRVPSFKSAASSTDDVEAMDVTDWTVLVEEMNMTVDESEESEEDDISEIESDE